METTSHKELSMPLRKPVLGIQVSVIDLPGLLGLLEAFLATGKKARINYLNIHGANLAYIDGEYRSILNTSDVLFCDGYGVKLGAFILGSRIGPRMTPPDWIDDLFDRCATAPYKVFVVGDEDEVLDAFVDAVQRRHPGIQIVGTRNGFFEMDGSENRQLIDEINQAAPDLILTGMGMPRQEKWAFMNQDALNKGVLLSVGALFRWYCGYEIRCPRWISDHGFEWLARLVTKPRQLWRRYVLGIPIFFMRVIKARFTR